MIDDIGGTTSQIVRLALDASLLRHEVISNNIANANTEGYQPQTVKFEELLIGIERDRSVTADHALRVQLEEAKHSVEGGEIVESATEKKVELDVEMTKMTENVIRYRALLEGLSKRGSIINMAITQQGSR